MKKTLEATIAANGGDTQKDKLKFLGMILTQNIDSEKKADFDQSATKHHLEQTGQDRSSEKMVQINDAIRLGTGQDLGVPQRFQIITKEGGVAFSVFAQSAGKVKDSQGNPLGSTNVEQLLLKSEAIGGIALSGSISFGDQLLHESDYNKVMFNSNKNMYRVEMPYKEVSPGKFVPNLELHAKLNRVQNRLKGQSKIKQNILSALKAEGISEHEVQIDEQGNLTARNTMPFLVLGGIAGSGTLDFNEESPYVHNLSREEGNSYKGIYNNIILFHLIKRRVSPPYIPIGIHLIDHSGCSSKISFTSAPVRSLTYSIISPHLLTITLLYILFYLSFLYSILLTLIL